MGGEGGGGKESKKKQKLPWKSILRKLKLFTLERTFERRDSLYWRDNRIMSPTPPPHSLSNMPVFFQTPGKMFEM